MIKEASRAFDRIQPFAAFQRNLLPSSFASAAAVVMNRGRYFASTSGLVEVTVSTVQGKNVRDLESTSSIPDDNATGIQNDEGAEVDEDEMEQEDMFVQPDITLGTDKVEWGGPRRGGRFEEPTRFGDWERKGRCSDF